MKPEKIKHIELIQNIITRMNTNSFLIKGWAVTISAALFALAGTINDPYISFIAIGPIFMFWILDSIFLANERCFISLYSCVIGDNKLSIENKDLFKKERIKRTADNGNESILPNDSKEIKTTLLSMNFKPFRAIKRNNWYYVIRSYTIVWFYALLFISAFLVFQGMKSMESSQEPEVINVNSNLSSDTLNVKSIQPQNIINNVYVNDSLLNSCTINK